MRPFPPVSQQRTRVSSPSSSVMMSFSANASPTANVSSSPKLLGHSSSPKLPEPSSSTSLARPKCSRPWIPLPLELPVYLSSSTTFLRNHLLGHMELPAYLSSSTTFIEHHLLSHMESCPVSLASPELLIVEIPHHNDGRVLHVLGHYSTSHTCTHPQ